MPDIVEGEMARAGLKRVHWAEQGTSDSPTNEDHKM
jgi:hypothetical protein